MEEILDYLTSRVRSKVEKYLNENIEEIRLRAQRPIALKIANENKTIDYIVTMQDLLETFQKICEHSIYSYQKQICEGFITIKGGHRVGITGSAVVEDGQITNINYISSLNIRIAREKKNSANTIMEYIWQEDNILNTLIVSKPGGGKTTILRDIIRNISNKKTCGIVDERGEIASMYKGVPQNDIGILSDVIENSSKADGMRMLIRSMAPEIIACDEIGNKQDIEAINYAMCSGVKGVFTAHGGSLEELLLNDQIKQLLEKYLVEIIIFLDEIKKGEIKQVYKLDKENKTYVKI